MKKIIIFFSGIFVGFITSITVLVIIGIIIDNKGILLNRFYKFGDIKIAHLRDTDGDCLILAKDKKEFFYAVTEINKPNEVSNIVIADQNTPHFKITASEEKGKWKNAMYHKDNSEEYTDINFDGQFDIKDVYDDTGELIALFIYVNKEWKRVNEIDDLNQARCGQNMYFFDSNSGWRTE